MYNEELDRYNYLSINLFIFPIISSFYYKCNLFLFQSSMILITGFSYHYSMSKIKKLTPILTCVRYFDMLVVHSASFYIFYYTLYFNIYSGISTMCLTSLFFLYYLRSKKFSHSYIHLFGSTAILSAIQSCRSNDETCHMC